MKWNMINGIKGERRELILIISHFITNSDGYKGVGFFPEKAWKGIPRCIFEQIWNKHQNILPWLQEIQCISFFCILRTHEHLIYLGLTLVNSVAWPLTAFLTPCPPIARRSVS